MDRFHIIEDSAVILRSKGVFRQVRAYRRGNEIYAGWGNGYIRLLSGSATTHPNVSWDGIEANGVDWTGPAQKPAWNQ